MVLAILLQALASAALGKFGAALLNPPGISVPA